MLKNKSHIILLVLFFSSLVINGLVNIPILHLIGKIGKVVIAFSGIVILQKSILNLKFFIHEYKWLVVFWLLSMLFMCYGFITEGFNIDLFQHNLLFIIYIYFLYLLFSTFKTKHRQPELEFYKSMAYITNFHFLFWTVFALGLGFNIWHTLGSRTGLGLFYENYIQLGIFACVGAIVNFSVLRFKRIKEGKLYILMTVIFTVLVFLSNSRNSQLVLGIVFLFTLAPYLKKLLVKHSYQLTVVLMVLFFVFFTGEALLNDELSKFTTGRSSIWYYIYTYYLDHSILFGKGIFGLNNIILEENRLSSYYLRELDFLYFHSSYLEVLSAAGLLGLISFISFLFKVIKDKKNLYMLSIIIAALAGGLFESYLVQPSIMISFLFWYLAIGNIGIYKDKNI